MRTPLTPLTVTPYQRRHTSAASPHCQPPVQREGSHACNDDYDDKALCPMCHLPMHVCDGHPLLTDAELFADYCERNKQAARYEEQEKLFNQAQMAALSPEAARFAKMKVARE